MSNEAENKARRAKAVALLGAIRSVMPTITASIVAAMSDEDWANAAKIAGTHLPSEKTKALVVRLCQDDEGDPFSLFPTH